MLFLQGDLEMLINKASPLQLTFKTHLYLQRDLKQINDCNDFLLQIKYTRQFLMKIFPCYFKQEKTVTSFFFRGFQERKLAQDLLIDGSTFVF